MNKFQIESRLINFAVGIIALTKTLENDISGQYFGHQLLRSGGSPALHYGEALGAESTKDFIHKLSIGVKELRESYNNLRIIRNAKLSKQADLLDSLISECNELISILVATIKTSKANLYQKSSK
jgi:four helix bundle protein